MQDFVHLHVHTQFSLLDGQASIPKLVDKAVADGMRGMAIVLVTAGLLSLAFMGFSGVDGGLKLLFGLE